MDNAARLAAIDLLAFLPVRARERLESSAAALDLGPGDTSNALEAGGLVLFVMSGRLRVSTIAGSRIGFADLTPGDISGLAETVAGLPVPPCAILALDRTEAIAVPAEALRVAIRSNAPAAYAVARHLAGLLMAKDAAADPLQKVYRDMLRAARPVGDSRWTIDPLPRHRDLAASAGVDEGDAASAIAHLIRLGVARRRYPALDIEDRDALRALAG
jgi:CRP-like cAMP-binding protein